MIIVVARLEFDSQAARDTAVERSAHVQKATRDDEPGCLMYCFAADPVVETDIQVYELWTDPDALAAHFEHPNYAAMVEVLRGVPGFVQSITRQYVADDRGTVYDNGTPRIDALR